MQVLQGKAEGEMHAAGLGKQPAKGFPPSCPFAAPHLVGSPRLQQFKGSHGNKGMEVGSVWPASLSMGQSQHGRLPTFLHTPPMCPMPPQARQSLSWARYTHHSGAGPAAIIP